MKVPELWVLSFEHNGRVETMLIRDEHEAETRTRAGQDVWRVDRLTRVTLPNGADGGEK